MVEDSVLSLIMGRTGVMSNHGLYSELMSCILKQWAVYNDGLHFMCCI